LGYATTDGAFSCPARNADQLLSAYTPTYAYEFADENAPPAQADFGGLLTFPLGAYHTRSCNSCSPASMFSGFPSAYYNAFEQEMIPPRPCASTGRSSRRRAIRTSLASRHGPAYNATSDLFNRWYAESSWRSPLHTTPVLCSLGRDPINCRVAPLHRARCDEWGHAVERSANPGRRDSRAGTSLRSPANLQPRAVQQERPPRKCRERRRTTPSPAGTVPCDGYPANDT